MFQPRPPVLPWLVQETLDRGAHLDMTEIVIRRVMTLVKRVGEVSVVVMEAAWWSVVEVRVVCPVT